ncbi:hypothetical protein ElyMa_001557300 [Elysia marginata]|uniref:Uncharacterized protein n=1 Tax=Elysia marginata TaxID=1093978 RepID=A0AAV4JG16_9GAST|nr:hypothetical protein ElyMa_001557300 [Elysia marginata]
MEDVQRRATRLLASTKNKLYSERLRALGLPSPEHWLNRGDMIGVSKYLNAFHELDQTKFSLSDAGGRDPRGNSLKLSKPRFGLISETDLLSNQITARWNSLPDNVATASTLYSLIGQDKYLDNTPTRSSPIPAWNKGCLSTRGRPRACDVRESECCLTFNIWFLVFQVFLCG